MTMQWRKPELICFKTKELLCKVKAKAGSVASCTSAYLEENGCPELSVGDTWGGGGEGGDLQCGVLSQCIEVGPLFGCDDENYCSSLAYLLR